MAQLPTQSQFGDYSEWPGRDVLDSGGQRLGGVREIYLDRETGRPEWVLVDVDDGDARFVPLADASVESRSIKVAHTAEKIKSAPGIGAEPRIDQSEERRLYAHYGLGYSEDDSGSGLPSDEPPAPTGWGQKEEPAWQARGGETTEPQAPERAAESTPPTDTWSTAAEPTNDAPPPADPPSPAEIEAAQIPEEPPAASVYETAPFGAVTPRDEPQADEPPLDTADDAPPVGAVDAPPLFDEPADEPAPVTDTPVGATDDRSPSPPDSAPDETPSALTPHAAPPEDAVVPDPVDPDVPADLAPPADPADLADPSAAPLDAPPLGTLDSPPVDVPPALDTPPVTIDTPEAADSPPTAPDPASIPTPPLGATPPSTEEPAAAGGPLERVKREPKKVALAAVGAAVLFFIIRRLR